MTLTEATTQPTPYTVAHDTAPAALQHLYEETHALTLSDARGIYIPRDAVECLHLTLTDEQREELADPENIYYWDTWEEVLNADHHHNGKKFNLYQNGDLYTVDADKWQEGLDAIAEAFPDCDIETELEDIFCH
jgi:hypothetical protein